MPVGGCSTATYYSPSAVHSGTTDYLTTSTCIFSDRPVDSTRCFVYNTIGKLQCILFSDATKAPSTVVSTTAPTTTTSSSTSIANRLSCAYGTTTFPFTWKLCSGQSCATSSSTIAQCKEIFTSTTHSISWSPPSSSSISSMRTSISTNPSRTQSATVTPTFHPGNQKIEIYLDDSIVGFLSTLVVRYCQYQWCENALIHSEIMDNLHLNGFTADELRSRRLSNTNEYVFEDNNATEWWATNAMTDYITQEYIHNRPLGRTIVIDEMLQGLESEKLAEYNEDESPTTSTATVQEAPTLTPVCSLSSGVPMAIDEVMALASALEWRFGQMVLKPKSTPSCVPYQVGAQYACRCNISTTTGTFRMNPRTYTTTQGGSAKLTTNICGYTTWPKGSTAAIATNKPKTQSSGRRIPTATLRTSTSSKSSTTFASGAGPMPTESPRCEKDGVWWESRVFDNSIASFCKALVDENWKATGNNKLPYHYDYKIVGRDSWPHDRDLRLLIQFEEKACRSKSETVVEFTENSSSKGRISRKSCMEHFTRVKNCGKPMRSDNKDFFLGAGLYSSCLWWRAYRTGSKNPAPGVQKLAALVDELSLNVTRNIEESLRALERDQHSSNDTAGLTLDQAIDLKNGTGRNGTSADL
ncbi:hypothetical protein CERZMDRAFT_93791 [Cercospora zeae-maydis SCOH1-5]|uniref:Uncharacterized protein n=1 Tax=Cercospora zeae-maydis SCOH1-5 TaxID=717836 RepID=A0A6A6FSZ0_9PEZI|nr:hypothetical protein CERZMDRAFT_93791 [Cercospora zeae-maydis SCOH1-5]